MHVNKTEYSALGMNIMTDDQAERIHNGTLQILERAGVKVFETEALELLRAAGARVDHNLVKMPAWMVQDALQSVPKVVSLYTRSGAKAINLEKGRIHYGAGSEVPFTVDLDNGQRRKVLKTDVRNSARLIDALDHIDFAMSLGLISDVPVEISDVYQFEAMLLNTQKPILFTCYSRRNLDCIIEMTSLAVGGKEMLRERPNIALYAEPTSPLVHSREALEKALTCAAEGIPLIYATTPMLGATGPVTVAGSLVLANAEILSGLVIHQLKAKGAPFIYGGGIPPMHMGTSICSYGGPERDRGCIALVRMSQYYGIPSFTTAGCTDAHTFDQQAGTEAGFNIAIAGLAGGNLIHDLGYMGVGMISCLEYLLLCNEVVGAVKNLVRGIAVDEEHLALDLIEKVGPGGHYLAEEHTMKHFREELYFPEALNRKNYDAWSADGSKTYGEAANARVKYLLDNHPLSELPPETIAAVQAKVNSIAQGGQR
jgi:trimethylamine---corrinoid protein Co-methyltransferase